MYVRVDLQPSAMLRLSQVIFHTLALASLPWVELDGSLRTVLALLIAISFLHGKRKHLQLPRAILFIDHNICLLLEDRVLEVVLEENVYCTSFLQVLHFGKRNPCVVILPDSSNTRNRRRLRTLLRWQALAVQTQGRTSSRSRVLPDQ